MKRTPARAGPAAAVARVLPSALVDTADVARALGVSPRSVQRWATGQAGPGRAAEERLLELAAVLELATQAGPGHDARLWLRSPMADLDWGKPLDLVRAGRYRDVLAAVQRLGAGAGPG
jgi:uncharacterized protein (DUF2384 family)